MAKAAFRVVRSMGGADPSIRVISFGDNSHNVSLKDGRQRIGATVRVTDSDIEVEPYHGAKFDNDQEVLPSSISSAGGTKVLSQMTAEGVSFLQLIIARDGIKADGLPFVPFKIGAEATKGLRRDNK